MSWTQGQHNRGNQSPFIDPVADDRQPKSTSSGYSKPNPQRGDYNSRNTAPTPRAPMRDVAATFTQEGLQTFATIFSSTVEAALGKELPDIVERVVNRKLEDVMQQLQGMWAQFADDLVARVEAASQVAANQVVQVATVAAETSAPADAASVDAAAVEAAIVDAAAPAAVANSAPVTPVSSVSSNAAGSLTSEPISTGTVEETTSGSQLSAEFPVQASVEASIAVKRADREELVQPSPVEETVVEETSVQETSIQAHVVPEPVAQAPVRGAAAVQAPAQAATAQAAMSEHQPVVRNAPKWPEEVEAVKRALRNAGRPVKADELRRMVPDIHWGNQPAIKMSTLVNKSKGQIQRVGRGIYQVAEMAE